MRNTIIAFTIACLIMVVLVGCSKPSAPATQPGEPGFMPKSEAPPPTATSATPGKPSSSTEKPAAPAAQPAAKSTTKESHMGPTLQGEAGKPVKTTKSGLKYIVLDEGKGAKPKQGDTISAEYTGYLTDGTKFDSSKDHGGQPLSFTVGIHQVIPGWDEALLDMKVGERRKLIVPANLAYKDAPPPGSPIPPNATLVFEVKLVKIGS